MVRWLYAFNGHGRLWWWLFGSLCDRLCGSSLGLGCLLLLRFCGLLGCCLLLWSSSNSSLLHLTHKEVLASCELFGRQCRWVAALRHDPLQEGLVMFRRQRHSGRRRRVCLRLLGLLPLRTCGCRSLSLLGLLLLYKKTLLVNGGDKASLLFRRHLLELELLLGRQLGDNLGLLLGCEGLLGSEDSLLHDYLGLLLWRQLLELVLLLRSQLAQELGLLLGRNGHLLLGGGSLLGGELLLLLDRHRFLSKNGILGTARSRLRPNLAGLPGASGGLLLLIDLGGVACFLVALGLRRLLDQTGQLGVRRGQLGDTLGPYLQEQKGNPYVVRRFISICAAAHSAIPGERPACN